MKDFLPTATRSPNVRTGVAGSNRRSSGQSAFSMGRSERAFTRLVSRPSAVPIHRSAASQPGAHAAGEVADTVLSASVLPVRQTRSGGWPVMRKCCQSCKDDDKTVMPKRAASAAGVTGADAATAVHAAGRGGIPMAESTRIFFESRFGHDFTGVRIHTDAHASAAAAAVNAKAYTVGQDIAFAAGAYAPTTPAGQHLLAHELTHTIQQRTGRTGLAAQTQISKADDPAEHEADAIADHIMKTTTQSIPIDVRTTGPTITTGTARRVARQPAQASKPAGPPHPDACEAANCTDTKPTTIGDDLTRARDYVTQAIAALGRNPLDPSTTRALDWYFGSHSQETADTVRTRLGCVLAALSDTQTSSRWACHPNYDALAYVRVDSTPVCADKQVPVCLTSQYFGVSDRMRAQVLVHECAHRVGMSLGRPASVPDIYRFTEAYLDISTADALLNSDSYALFAGGIAEGVPLSMRLGAGLSFGAAVPQRGEATWQARLYAGLEFQHPVLGLFNPTLGVGFSLIGSPVTAQTSGPDAPTASPTMLVSLLPGFRLGNPRPGSSGSGFVQFFGGPAVDIGARVALGAEAGLAAGYRWHWLDFSAGLGYAYEPVRALGMQHEFIPSVGISGFLPNLLGE